MEYQRHIHLQRLAEQEAEMQARLDQQRRYAQQREQQNQVDYRINQVTQKFISRKILTFLIRFHHILKYHHRPHLWVTINIQFIHLN